MAARYYCPQVWSHHLSWIDENAGASKRESEALRYSIKLAETHRVKTRVIRKPHGWVPIVDPDSDVFVDPDNTEGERALTNNRARQATLLVDAEDRERLSDQRKHEKARRRRETARLRIPTAWEQLLGEDSL